MNASQSKALLTAARKALALLNPDWPVSADLRAAIATATAPATIKGKCLICESPIIGETVDWLGKKLKPGHVHLACATAERERYARIYASFDQEPTRETKTREEYRICACGHDAINHREDENANLLECSNSCDCDHFHYAVSEAA